MLANMTDYEKLTYVRFYGNLESHNRDRLTTDRSTEDLKIPEKAWSFRFYTQYVAQVMDHETQKMVGLKSDPVNESPTHFCGGELFTLEDGIRLFAKHESVQRDDYEPGGGDKWTLFDEIAQGKHPGMTHVILCRDNNIRPFRQGVNVIVPV